MQRNHHNDDGLSPLDTADAAHAVDGDAFFSDDLFGDDFDAAEAQRPMVGESCVSVTRNRGGWVVRVHTVQETPTGLRWMAGKVLRRWNSRGRVAAKEAQAFASLDVINSSRAYRPSIKHGVRA